MTMVTERVVKQNINTVGFYRKDARIVGRVVTCTKRKVTNIGAKMLVVVFVEDKLLPYLLTKAGKTRAQNYDKEQVL